jgi:hypothetical protein
MIYFIINILILYTFKKLRKTLLHYNFLILSIDTLIPKISFPLLVLLVGFSWDLIVYFLILYLDILANFLLLYFLKISLINPNGPALRCMFMLITLKKIFFRHN